MNLFQNSCDGIYADSMDVRFGRQCDNHCPFCIEKNGAIAKPINVGRMIDSTLASGNRSILILGGEPLLLIPSVLQYINGIRGYAREIFLTTSLPHTIEENWDQFGLIMSALTCLNVSLQHYDWKTNNAIMRSSHRFNRIALLQRILDNYAGKVRVSINLVRGAIDNEPALDQFLHMMYDMGCKWVKINELQSASDKYVSFENLKPNLKMKSPYSHGCQTEIKIKDEKTHDYAGMKITVKRSCFCVEETKEATFSDLVKACLKKLHRRGIKKNYHLRNRVLYEDGRLAHGWEQNTPK